MTVGSGLGSSLGFGKETTWGTPHAPTRWCEFASETIEWKPKRIVGTGLAAGNLVQRSATRAEVHSTVEGDIKTPMYYKGMGLLLGSLMGSLTSGAPVSNVQTHALQISAQGQSLTFQKGVPEVQTGTVNAYTYAGCKVTKGVFEFSSDDYVQATFTIDGRSFDKGITAYTAPVYQLPNPIHSFNTSTLAIGAFGSEALIEGIRKATLTIERPYRVDNFYLDGTSLKQEQVQNNFCKIMLDLESDYLSDSAFAAQFAGDTATSIILSSTGPIFTGSTPYLFRAALPSLRWESGPPMVSGPDLVQPKLQLMALYDDISGAAHTPCTLTYVSTDTAL